MVTPALSAARRHLPLAAATTSADLGPTASADLGGAPRTSLDGTGTNAYAYVRLPNVGKYNICYRRAGGIWRVLSMMGSTTNHTLNPTNPASTTVMPYSYGRHQR